MPVDFTQDDIDFDQPQSWTADVQYPLATTYVQDTHIYIAIHFDSRPTNPNHDPPEQNCCPSFSPLGLSPCRLEGPRRLGRLGESRDGAFDFTALTGGHASQARSNRALVNDVSGRFIQQHITVQRLPGHCFYFSFLLTHIMSFSKER